MTLKRIIHLKCQSMEVFVLDEKIMEEYIDVEERSATRVQTGFQSDEPAP